VPLYLSADYHGVNPTFGVVVLGATGRFKLGISCVATGFVVVRVGPEPGVASSAVRPRRSLGRLLQR